MDNSYKNSLVGGVPSEWDEVLLGDIFEEIGDRTSNRKEYELYSLTIESGVVPKSERYEREFLTTKETDNYKIVQSEDFVYNPMNLRFGAIAKYSGQIPVCVSGYYNVFRVKNGFNPNFIEQYLKSKPFINLYNRISTGTLVEKRRVHFSNFIIQNIPFPTVEEQKQIFEILNTLDLEVLDIDGQIKDLTMLKKALAKKLLTEGIGHTEFKESEIGIIPVEWTVKCLRDITTIIMGQSPNSNSYNEEGEGLPFYQGKTEFGYMYPEAKKWCTEPTKVAETFDVLISVRAPVGTVNICEEKSCIGRGLGAVRETTNSYYKFIYYLLDNSQAKLNEVGQGSTFTAINSNDLASLKIAVPQIEEQYKIADILSALDNRILLYTDQKSDYTQLKEGLMQQLLTGKVRVVI